MTFCCNFLCFITKPLKNKGGGHYRIRTCDRLRVKELRYRCAKRPTWLPDACLLWSKKRRSQSPNPPSCDSDSGETKFGGRRFARTDERSLVRLMPAGLNFGRGRRWPWSLRAQSLRSCRRREASREFPAGDVKSSSPCVYGGARRFSNGVKKLSSSFRILASALARAAGASSNTSRVKVTRGSCVYAC